MRGPWALYPREFVVFLQRTRQGSLPRSCAAVYADHETGGRVRTDGLMYVDGGHGASHPARREEEGLADRCSGGDMTLTCCTIQLALSTVAKLATAPSGSLASSGITYFDLTRTMDSLRRRPSASAPLPRMARAGLGYCAL